MGKKPRLKMGDPGYPQTQKCVICGEVKPIDQYGFRKDKKYHRLDCRECANKKSLDYRLKNPDKAREKAKQHYRDNKEYYQIKHKIFKDDNPDYYLNYMRIWRADNKEDIRTRMNKYFKEKYHTDSNYRIRVLLGGRTRRVLKQRGIRKDNKTFHLLGCSLEEFKNHIESLFKNGMTWDALNNGEIHIDHIRPCSSFDLTDENQLKACFHYSNLQPLWAVDNLRKGKKYG